MNLYVQLGLVGGMMMLKPDQFPTQENNPELIKVLDTLGVINLVSGDAAVIRQHYLDLLVTLESQYDYYDPNDLFTNEQVNQYVESLFADYQQRQFEMPKQVAIRVCALGNQKGQENESSGVYKFINELQTLLTQMEGYVDGFPEAWSDFQFGLKAMEYIDSVLGIVNTFVMTKAGMMNGVEEFPPIDPASLPPATPSDFSVDDCLGSDDCVCGCAPDHALTLVQGLEDYLDGKDTYACRYAVGVALASSIKLDAVTGNEGKILDALKDMAKKAYDAIVESLKALKELVSPEEDKAKAKISTEDAEANKKAFQAMTDKTLQINPSASSGLNALADKTYPDGSMKKITDQLKTATDGPRVIDALLGLMQKEMDVSADLAKSQSDADKAVQDLKSATDKSSSVDETNKDVVDTFRAQVKDKMDQAKNVFKEAKAKVKGHNAKIAGIQKAIKGISPSIFPDPNAAEKKEEKEKEEK